MMMLLLFVVVADAAAAVVGGVVLVIVHLRVRGLVIVDGLAVRIMVFFMLVSVVRVAIDIIVVMLRPRVLILV